MSRHRACPGRVWHVRQAPFRHAFAYRTHMLLLDLDDLATAFRGRWLWSLDRPNLVGLRQRDFLDGHGDLATAARAAAEERLGRHFGGPVWLLTVPRYLGFGFNPVSFFFFGPPGAERPGPDLDAILLEVSNTPWNERHLYALDARGAAHPFTFETAKEFHVSPFLPMDMTYRFRFEFASDRMVVTKENWRGDNRVFTARMALEPRPLDGPALRRALLSHGPVSLGVLAAIYWQALRLWWRGAVYHPRPRASDRQ